MDGSTGSCTKIRYIGTWYWHYSNKVTGWGRREGKGEGDMETEGWRILKGTWNIEGRICGEI